MTKYSLRQSAA